jgi:hypothetical protein
LVLPLIKILEIAATAALATAAVGVCILAASALEEGDSEDHAERCKRVKQECIEYCSDITLDVGLHEPHFSRCKRACMEMQGC